MRWIPALIVALSVGCEDATPTEPALPEAPARRQLDLSERILSALPALAAQDAGTQADAALAVAEIVVPGHSPRLRLLAAGDNAAIARGAATALVRIRLLRQPAREPTLTECVHTETNQWVRDECARRLAAPADPGTAVPPAGVVDLLDARDVETRRSGLRKLLGGPEDSKHIDERVEGRLVHLLADGDTRVRLLTEAVFLRRSLAHDPPPIPAAVPAGAVVPSPNPAPLPASGAKP